MFFLIIPQTNSYVKQVLTFILFRFANSIEYGSEQFLEMWRNEEYDTLLPIVRSAAESGNMEAQCDLGLMYQFGWSVDIDMSAALKQKKQQ